MLKYLFNLFLLILFSYFLTACDRINIPSRDQAYLNARTGPVLPISVADTSYSGDSNIIIHEAISILPPKD